MDSIGQGGVVSNGGREASRGTERRVDSKVDLVPRDYPMLQGNQSREVKKIHFPYKEPRIDQRMYQAEIPRLQGRAPNRAVTRGSLSPRVGEDIFSGRVDGPVFVPVCRWTEVNRAQ